VTRFKMTRESYIPKNNPTVARITCRETDAICYTYEVVGENWRSSYVAIAFSGRRNKPDLHTSYKSRERRAADVAEWFRGVRQIRDFRAEQKRKRNCERTLKVGDILSSMWGYEQTNIDYYLVTALVGKTMVEVRKIAQKNVEQTAWQQGTCEPDPDCIIGKPIRCRVSHGNAITVDGHHASPWNGKANHWTAYH